MNEHPDTIAHESNGMDPRELFTPVLIEALVLAYRASDGGADVPPKCLPSRTFRALRERGGMIKDGDQWRLTSAGRAVARREVNERESMIRQLAADAEHARQQRRLDRQRLAARIVATVDGRRGPQAVADVVALLHEHATS